MRTSINVVGDSFGAGIVDHLSRVELAELDAAELEAPPLEEELGFLPPPPLLTEMDLVDPFKPPELPPRSPRPLKQNHHGHALSQSHSITYSPSRSIRSPSPHSVRSPSPRSVCSHSPRPFRTHSPRLLHRSEAGYCALPSHDNQVGPPLEEPLKLHPPLAASLTVFRLFSSSGGDNPSLLQRERAGARAAQERE